MYRKESNDLQIEQMHRALNECFNEGFVLIGKRVDENHEVVAVCVPAEIDTFVSVSRVLTDYINANDPDVECKIDQKRLIAMMAQTVAFMSDKNQKLFRKSLSEFKNAK